MTDADFCVLFCRSVRMYVCMYANQWKKTEQADSSINAARTAAGVAERGEKD